MNKLGELLLKLWTGGASTLVVIGWSMLIVLAYPIVYERFTNPGKVQTVPVEVYDWRSPLAETTANLVAEIHSGSAPRRGLVPYWSIMDRHAADMEAWTRATNRLSSSLDQHTAALLASGRCGSSPAPRSIRATKEPEPPEKPRPIWVRAWDWLTGWGDA